MTDAPAAILATYYTWRPVAGRKSLQLVFEVPPEKQTEVLTALGPPDSLGSVWCAIALLDPKAAEAARNAQGAQAPVLPKSTPPLVNTREKREFKSLPLSQQAALACDREAFRRFLSETWPEGSIETAADAAQYVRDYCRVKSRSHLESDGLAGDAWITLYQDFEDWLRAPV
jgi:hypothetical protein